MKKRFIQKWLCFVLLLWGGGGVQEMNALPAQKLVYPGEWLYDALTALSLEQGRIFFTGSTLTIAQVELMVAEIDEDALSPSGRVLYEQIHSYLAGSAFFSYKSDVLTLNVDGALQPEFYFKTNRKLNWIYERKDRLPFLLVPADISIASYITLGSELYFGENRMLSNAHDNYFNFPFDTMIDGLQSVDVNVPKRAYLSAGLPLGERSGLNFRIGIGDDVYGRTKTGSVILSDAMKGVNYANLTFYSPIINYTADIKQFEVNKYLYLHHFQMKFFNRLSLSLIEGVMVNAPFEIRYLNPMMIFHGFTAWEDYGGYNEQIGEENLSSANSRIGSFAGISLDWRPWKYFRIYGLFAMNEFEIPAIEGGEDSTTPNAMAFQLGTEIYMPVSSGYWTFGLEGVYTYPYMYILSNKNWSFYREAHEVNEASNPPIPFRDWVGTPFGPDSVGGTLWAGYHDSSQWSASLSFLFVAQGKNADTRIFDKPDPDNDKKLGNSYYPETHKEAIANTPSGIPAYTYQISALGKWIVYDWLTLSLRAGYKIIQNFDHIQGRLEQGFETTLSVQLTPKANWAIRLP
jgi:hypothetical protein